jgi:WD40 repeat protein
MLRLRGILVLAATAALSLPAVARSQPTNRSEVTAVLFRPDGKTLISAGLDGQLRTWDVATGRDLSRVEAHKDCVYGAALSADGKRLATAGGDKLVKLWDATTLKPVRNFEGHTQEVVAVAFSPDGKVLATGGADRTIRLWDVATGKQIRLFHGHELKVTSLAFSPDGKVLASGGTATPVIPGFFLGGAVHADEVRLWDPATGNAIRKLPLRGSVVALAADGQTVMGGGTFIAGMQAGRGVSIRGGSQVAVSDLTGKKRLLVEGQGGAAAFSPDGKFLATAWGSRQHLGRVMLENETRHRRVSLWELASGKEVLQLQEESATAVAISPDGKKIATGHLTGVVRFRDLTPGGGRSGKKVAELTPEQLDSRWQLLAGENATAAYVAICVLAEAGDRAAVLLGERLEAVKPAGPRVKQLLANLDSKRFAAREAAFRELKKLGSSVEPELRQALQGRVSAEVRKRVQSLLEQYGRHPATPEEMRQSRALVVLERVATSQARAVLTRLAEGAPGAWLTEEARAALRRLERRTEPRP